MRFQFKLFNFFGKPVELSIWFFLLLLFLSTKAVFLIFISVLVHEMAHVLIATKLGYKTFGIKIDILFGSVKIQQNIPAKDDIKIVLAGPISNLILFLISIILISIWSSDILSTLVYINLFMFLLNMLPIFPLDGGRVVRDILFCLAKPQIAVKISAVSSLIFSLTGLYFSIAYSIPVVVVFCLLFIYNSFCDLGIIKTQSQII